jgi:DNA polymerase-1
VFDKSNVHQLALLPGLAAAFGFAEGKPPGYEADDFLAAAAAAETRRGGHSLQLTTDKDAYQLVSDQVTVLAPRKGIRDLMRIGPEGVVERFGVLPEQVADYKALAGDSSDNIPGAKGIGPKAAASLLLQFGNLEGVIAARAATMSPTLAEQLRTYRDIVTMRGHELTVELPPSGPPTFARAAKELERLGAQNLSERVAALAEAQP